MEYFDILNEDGEYISEVKSREECHKNGYFHKAVVLFIISSDNKKILLQQRSKNKKLWPGLWDVAVGGHVLTNELGYEAVIRETKEEIGLDIKKEELEFIGAMRSINQSKDIINKHFNEYYLLHKDVDIKKLTIQKEEVEDIKWFDKKEVMGKIKNNYQDLTGKEGCWDYLVKYFEIKGE